MASTKLPSFHFERGLRMHRRIPDSYGSLPGTTRERFDWTLVGRLQDGTPFMLTYAASITNWWCSANLGPSMRKKILDGLRALRTGDEALPEYITAHDIREKDDVDSSTGAGAAWDLFKPFHDQVWLREYLGELEEDWIVLEVPFAEKDAASKLGAVWNGELRKWRVKRDAELALFSKWLPAKTEQTELQE